LGCSVFITATDTDAGKSYLTASLSRALLARGVDAFALKPVSCGYEAGEMNPDIASLLDAQDMGSGLADEINLYHFEAYAAPMFAAQAEGESVDVEELADWCDRRSQQHDLTLIEGVGGLMVPLAEGVLVSDWLQLMPHAKVLLVVRARLGGINQALLSIDKLQRMGRGPDWVVVNAADEHGGVWLADHCAAIAPYMGSETCLYEMPWLPGQDDAEAFLSESELFAVLEAMVL